MSRPNDFNVKSLVTWLTLFSILLTGAGVLVKYNTSGLCSRMDKSDVRMDGMQKEINLKANQAEMEILFKNLTQAIKDLKDDFKDTRDQIRSDIKELRK